jgi:hypothetical protein
MEKVVNVIVFEAGDNKYGFYVGANANKTFADFCEHEKHHNLSKDQLKEVWSQIQAEAKKQGLIKTKEKTVEQ